MEQKELPKEIAEKVEELVDEIMEKVEQVQEVGGEYFVDKLFLENEDFIVVVQNKHFENDELIADEVTKLLEELENEK